MAFHPYPQLIPPVFNRGGFGPPHALTRASTWPWVDHPASGPERATKTPKFQTRFRYDYPTRVNLATRPDSQAHSSKGTPPPNQTRNKIPSPAGSDGLQAPGFRYSFTPLPGYFSPFPHGTNPLSVTRKYLGSQVVLADSRRTPRTPRYKKGKTRPTPHQQLQPTGLSPSTAPLPRGSG